MAGTEKAGFVCMMNNKISYMILEEDCVEYGFVFNEDPWAPWYDKVPEAQKFHKYSGIKKTFDDFVASSKQTMVVCPVI